MTSLYFLDGLGSNRFYTEKLAKALENLDIELVYLALPGHSDGGSLSEDFWGDLSAKIPVGSYLAGFSLGADLAAAFARFSGKIAKLILLDGAVFDRKHQLLDDQLQEAQAYIDSQVYDRLDDLIALEPDMAEAIQHAHRWDQARSKYVLNCHLESMLGLLRLANEVNLSLLEPDFSTPTLVILSDSPAEFLDEKVAVLQKANSTYVNYQVLPQSSHNLYNEHPESIAQRVSDFLSD